MTKLAGGYTIKDLQAEVRYIKSEIRKRYKNQKVSFGSPVVYSTEYGMSLRLDYQITRAGGSTSESFYSVAL